LRSQEAAASRFSISLTKQRLILVSAWDKLIGIQTTLVRSLWKACNKGFAKVSMQFRCWAA
jgi:hypothetical protein